MTAQYRANALTPATGNPQIYCNEYLAALDLPGEIVGIVTLDVEVAEHPRDSAWETKLSQQGALPTMITLPAVPHGPIRTLWFSNLRRGGG